MSQAKCPLCQGQLVTEEPVSIGTSAGDLIRRAWVCTQCSAAFPIAVHHSGLFGGKWQPLYENGTRATSRP